MTRAATFVLCWLLAACGAGGGGADGGCPGAGQCGEPPEPSLRWAAALIPAGASGQTQQEAAEIRFDSNGLARITLAPTRRLDARLSTVGGEAVAVQAVASRPSLMPGADVVSYQTVPDLDGHFELALPPATYQLRLLPQNPADQLYPPLTRTVELAEGDVRLEISFPNLADLPSLRGRVVSALGEGLPQTSVYALDASSGWLLSSWVTTDDDGNFAMALSPDVAPDQQLRVIALPAAARPNDAPSWSTRLVRHVTWSADAVVEMAMPPLPSPVAVVVPVQGRDGTGLPVAISGCRLDFSADLTDPKSETTAHFAVTAISDEQGRASVSLVAGPNQNRTYRVGVTPPAQSAFAGTVLELPVGPLADQGILETIELTLRPVVTGRVLTPTGSPVAGAFVMPQMNETPLLVGVTSVTQTDDDGGFSLGLDPGTYDVDFLPPAETLVARWSLTALSVEQDGQLGDIVLPRAAAALLEVRDATGLLVPDVHIRLYQLVDDCAGDVGICPPRLRAEGDTDGLGLVRLLLEAQR